MKSMGRVISLILLVVICGCNTRDTVLSPVQYIKFMESPENNFNRKVIAGSTEYHIQFATPEYMALKGASEASESLDTGTYFNRLREMSGHIFFLIRIKQEASTGIAQGMVEKSDAEKMVMYYQQAAAQDIALHTKKIEQHPITYQFENNYSLVPYNTIVVGFESEISDDFDLVFNDRFNDNPYIKTEFSQKELAMLPRISIK